MSDGPHRSLAMPRSWKKFAECVYNPAFPPNEMRDALGQALDDDIRKEIPPNFINRVRDTLFPTQPNLFEDRPRLELEELRRETTGSSAARVFLDTLATAQESNSSDELLTKAAVQTIQDIEARRSRQVEEHYYRQPQRHLDPLVRERLQRAFGDLDETALARRLIDGGKSMADQKPTKQLGLDDGVPI